MGSPNANSMAVPPPEVLQNPEFVAETRNLNYVYQGDSAGSGPGYNEIVLLFDLTDNRLHAVCGEVLEKKLVDILEVVVPVQQALPDYTNITFVHQTPSPVEHCLPPLSNLPIYSGYSSLVFATLGFGSAYLLHVGYVFSPLIRF
jgi:hypothetical protein